MNRQPLLLTIMITVAIFALGAQGAESEAKKIVFLGDSLTAGYGIAQESAYPSLIKERLKEENLNVEIVNASVSGSTTASAQKRLRWQLKGQPDLLFLALGANDGLRGFKIDVTEANLRQAIELAQKNSVQVILAGMKLPPNYGKDYANQFEALFSRLAKEYKLVYVPFLLKDVGGRKELNLPDGIHPNVKGHKIIAETVYPYIKEAL